MKCDHHACGSICRYCNGVPMVSHCHYCGTTIEKHVPKMFMDILTAADLAGFSLRHFRRIIEDAGIPIVEINRKFFILGRDFATLQADHQLDRRRRVKVQ